MEVIEDMEQVFLLLLLHFIFNVTKIAVDWLTYYI